jgi:hypothetical protein
MAPRPKRGLKCDANKHLWRLGGVAVAIYWKLYAVTYAGPLGHNDYFTSVESMAEFLGCDYSTCSRAFRSLVDAGWLLKDGGNNPYKSKNYHIVTHDDWVPKNPGQCYEREQMVWDGEAHDKLAQDLWKASNGNTVWQKNLLASLRKTGFTDEEILTKWHAFVATLNPMPKAKQWRGVQFKFIKELAKARAALTPHIDEAELAVNSTGSREA